MGAVCSTERGSRSSTDESWCPPLSTLLTPSKKRKPIRFSPPSPNIWRRRNIGSGDGDDVYGPDSSSHNSRQPRAAHNSERLCNNGSTNSACAFSQQGQKGVNQDAFLVWENFASMKDTVLCAVFDGHGPDGHMVARKVRDSLPIKLMSALKTRLGSVFLYDETDDIDVDIEGCSSDEGTEHRREITFQRNQATFLIHPAVIDSVDSDVNHVNHNKASLPGAIHNVPDDTVVTSTTWRDCILRCCTLVDRELKAHATGFSCLCSGTTAVILLKQGKELIIGNVGDSRAVLARTQAAANGTSTVAGGVNDVPQLEAVQLTVDLKPDIAKEEERIERCKGRVFALDDEPEVSRLWLPHDDAPGLAMARAFGDFCLKDYGLISVPEMTYRKLTASDQFVILATDGIWDVLSNMQAVETVSTAPSRASAAQFLVETAVEAWSVKYPTSKIDDCAAICLFFGTDTINPEVASSCRRSSCLFSGANFHDNEEDNMDILNEFEAENGRTRERDMEDEGQLLMGSSTRLVDKEQTASHARSYSLCWGLADQFSQRMSVSDRDNHQQLAAVKGASTSVEDGIQRTCNCVMMRPTSCFGSGPCLGVRKKGNNSGSRCGGHDTVSSEVAIPKERQLQLSTDKRWVSNAGEAGGENHPEMRSGAIPWQESELVARADSVLNLPR